MATVITGIQNNTDTTYKLLVPGYNTSRPNITINALTSYNLFDILTPDEIWAMQVTFEPLVQDGTFSITATSIFPFTPITSLKADSNNPIVGDIQLVSGANITLQQTGATVTINSFISGGSTWYKDLFTVIVPSNHIYVLSNTPRSNSEIVSFNGLVVRPGLSNDYTLSTNVLTFTPGVSFSAGDQLEVTYIS